LHHFQRTPLRARHCTAIDLAGDFFNGGSKSFMDIALSQAAISSPDSDIILLTNGKRPGLPEVTQARLADYWTWDALKFRWRYKHTSDSPLRYERFCFIRWYYIREFVRRHRIGRFCLLDTDILLFSPIETFAAEFSGYRAGNRTWANVISDVSILDEIIAYFERIFREVDRATKSRPSSIRERRLELPIWSRCSNWRGAIPHSSIRARCPQRASTTTSTTHVAAYSRWTARSNLCGSTLTVLHMQSEPTAPRCRSISCISKDPQSLW
jgi:hypothetical protein